MSSPARCFVACDVTNLVDSCRRQYGDDARLDFGMLGRVVPAVLHPEIVTQVLTAYIVVHNKTKSGQNTFQRALNHLGFTVKSRDTHTRTDWDVGIAIDAVDRLPHYDTYVLMSGDGDFAMLLEYLRAHGKRTIVMTFELSASRKLYDTADLVIPFTQAVVTRKT